MCSHTVGIKQKQEKRESAFHVAATHNCSLLILTDCALITTANGALPADQSVGETDAQSFLFSKRSV